jgi:hypothetical protein
LKQHIIAFVAVLGLLDPAAASAQSQADTGLARDAPPRSYALVAALGDEIGVVTEGPTTGTHLSPFRRTSVDVPGNLLNRFVLNALDSAIAKLDPDSKRVYMTLAAGRLKEVAAPRRESAALAEVVAALVNMPQRPEWDAIVVVTPTYTGVDREGLPGKLQGPGVFVEPMCQGRTGLRTSDYDSCGTDARPPAGRETLTPEGEVVRTNFFLAPFSYLQVRILDPRTLAVLDQQKVFDSQKLYDPHVGRRTMVSEEFLTARFGAVVQASVRRAVEESVLRGQVEVGPVRGVEPDDARN